MEKIQQMQFFQENLQSILMQKQAFQMELNETISALKEVEKSNEDVYKLIGQLMIKISSQKILEELKNKEKILQIRLKKLEEQEENLNSEVKKIRDEIIKDSKKKN
ncbi:prefoldin subunit beta [archaeon]|nr:prefoldin subunit beta [archaeon]PJC45486.1 MAG: prefoldin subunit beta [Candidatus Pacearchaeota archaeon CG_4_9_14_0_2_um_filter_30_8]